MLTDQESVHLRTAIQEAIRDVANQSATLSGWLALDCAEMLVLLARQELGPAITPEQSDELDEIVLRLRRVAAYV
ncbi:hypothetical protein [Jannaschia sp. LMIT008]|uniref:hypothetical protein n=1 Tax=Jannaschia maritima TaxID=3032585 RepID=UPI00281224DA|nr:hypothetical protein [Jannaschia sp. LMIT008]